MRPMLAAALCAACLGPHASADVAPVAVDLATQHTSYHVGDAVRLTLTVKNNGTAPLFGRWRLEPYLPAVSRTHSLVYCRDAAPCIEYLASMPGESRKDFGVGPMRLAASQQDRHTFVVALNPANGRLVLDEPGSYEFRWTTWGIHGAEADWRKVRGPELSASAFVHVLPVPQSEREAFQAYVDGGLANWAQFNRAFIQVTPDDVSAAGSFLERFPDSRYAEAVRAPLREFLHVRVLYGSASAYEQELLRKVGPSKRLPPLAPGQLPQR